MFDEDWTIEDEDYSYELEAYSDEDENEEENTKIQETPEDSISTPKIVSPPKAIKKQISINNRYVRRKSGAGPSIGLLGSSPPKHQSDKFLNNIQTSGFHSKNKNKSTANNEQSNKPAPTLSRQNSTKTMQQMFIDYCNNKVDVQNLVNEIVNRVLSNPDVARQICLTVGVIIKDEQARSFPKLQKNR